MEEAVNQGGGRVGGDLDTIKADLNKLRADISSLTQDLFQIGRAGAGDARERMTEEMRARLDQLNATYRETAERARGLWRTAQTSMEENPLPTVGLAFGAGLLVGLLLLRK